MVTSQELGCDCLGDIDYVDAVIGDSRGEPQAISQAICLHEGRSASSIKPGPGDRRSGPPRATDMFPEFNTPSAGPAVPTGQLPGLLPVSRPHGQSGLEHVALDHVIRDRHGRGGGG